jgi:hypothetical protein
MNRYSTTVILCTLFILASVCSADAQTIRICLGQYETRCGPHDLFLECGADVQKTAQQICSVQGPNPRQLDFSLTKGSDVGGNRCGYAMFLLICREPAKQ